MIKRILNQTKALRTLRKTAALLDRTLHGVTQADAVSLRDGPDGWSVLFIACHLRDYEVAWRERVERMLVEEHPTFVHFDHHAVIETHAYAEQDLRAVLADIAARRAALLARLEGLSDEEWLRTGLHPEQGPGSVLDVAINAGLHDLDHLEQLERCLDPLRS
jgi:DinB superfamily